MKSIIRTVLAGIGLSVHRAVPLPKIGSEERAVGEMKEFLEDLKSRGLQCGTIADVGANSAKWSRIAKAVFPGADFFLIEPQMEMKPHLEKFCAETPGSNYINAGAGAEKGELTFTVWDDFQGSSFLLPEETSLKENGRQRKVEVTTIDHLVETGKLKIPVLMKLDVQGFELEVLKGANKILGVTEAFILEVALHEFYPNTPLFSTVIDFMRERNYVVYDFPGFLRRPLDGALGYCYVCFVKADGIFRTSDKWSK
jgi:FkbM family methyltransferase